MRVVPLDAEGVAEETGNDMDVKAPRSFSTVADAGGRSDLPGMIYQHQGQTKGN